MTGKLVIASLLALAMGCDFDLDFTVCDENSPKGSICQCEQVIIDRPDGGSIALLCSDDAAPEPSGALPQ